MSGCGSGLTGHIATDSAGRLFVPQGLILGPAAGQCAGFPWIAISEDGGDSWNQVQISRHIGIPDHEVSIAVDAADNLHAVWWDDRERLPYLASSTDHGRTWSVPLMIAPPGVHEVNWPTITAGDAGRIAITFPGTEVNDQSDRARAWNAYTLVSADALASDPLFTWRMATDPAYPLVRGLCGPGQCYNVGDFLDIQTSPADGTFWATTVSSGMGLALSQISGPLLWAPERR